jgi:hypothetical protein
MSIARPWIFLGGFITGTFVQAVFDTLEDIKSNTSHRPVSSPQTLPPSFVAPVESLMKMNDSELLTVSQRMDDPMYVQINTCDPNAQVIIGGTFKVLNREERKEPLLKYESH